ncbi:MAG: hypothetical protein ACE5FS_05450 [Paracoccaceae bacterium]
MIRAGLAAFGLALIAGCAAGPSARGPDYLCGGPPPVRVSSAYIAATPGVRLIGAYDDDSVDVGVSGAAGTGGGIGLALGKTFRARPRNALIEWPDGTRMACVPVARGG